MVATLTDFEYRPKLANAIFHYKAWAAKDERFEMCIATDDMKEAAWRYAHKSQVVLDGIFGVCNKKILLFILMGVDENCKGVPLAFFLFSAPGGNQKTCAGYNMEIIAKLLQEWKRSLGRWNNELFKVYVAITDTDLMERGVLVLVFPKIWLLICRFHLRQSWRNHYNKLLKGKTPMHVLLKKCLKGLKDDLVATVTICKAQDLITYQMKTLIEMSDDDDIAKKGIEHITYLQDYWTTPALWQCWSEFGQRIAAEILKCPIEGVLPTTNHLESFNGVLKWKHLQRWQHGGQQVCLDMLIILLVTKILPSIFQQHTLRRQEDL